MSKRDPDYDPTFPYYFPTSRIRKIIVDAMEEAGFDLDEPNSGAREWVCHRTGLHARMLFRIMTEEGPTTTFDQVDKILCGLNLLHLFQLPPEQGGLADFYLCTDPEELPELPTHTPEQRAFADKHNKWRKQRKEQRKAELERSRRQVAVA